MNMKCGLLLIAILGVPASGALAQPAVQPAPPPAVQAAAEAPLLRLPMGARVRLRRRPRRGAG